MPPLDFITKFGELDKFGEVNPICWIGIQSFTNRERDTGNSKIIRKICID